MAESERPGVEHLPRRLDRRTGEMSRTVDRIADDGMSDRGEVDADLVRPSGFESERDERGRRHAPENAVMRDGTPAFFPRARRPAAAVARVADQIESDRPGVAGDVPFDDRHVLALDVVAAEELLESAERLPGAGEHDRARGVLVEPMDDADVGPPPIPVLEVRVHPGEKRVLLARFRREREKARGLVDDDERRILAEDEELRPDVSDGRSVDVERHARVVADLTPRLAADRAVDVDAARLHVIARLAARERVLASDSLIETHARDCMMAGS